MDDSLHSVLSAKYLAESDGLVQIQADVLAVHD